jgi:hypothetical protein
VSARLILQSKRKNFVVDGERLVRPANEADSRPVRMVWNAFHTVALQHYKKTRAPDPEMEARNAGWRAVKLYISQPGVVGWYRNGYKVGWKHSEVVPDPGTLPVIGKLMEVTYLTKAGGFAVLSYREPRLPDVMWDDKKKRLLCYTNLPQNVVRDKYVAGEDEAVKVYKRWHKRPPGSQEIHAVPTYRVGVIGSVDCVTYRSDKWDKPNLNPELQGSPEYLHQDDIGVFVEVDRLPNPNLIVIQGGRLDALTEGLIH